MNTIQITTTQNSVTLTRTRLVVLFVLLLLSSLGMFGQNTQKVITASAITTSVAANDDTVTTTATTSSAVEANSNMNFVSWFMGTKQTPKTDMTSGDAYNKRQLINSGIAPNRLLIKAFLKKAANYQSTVA